MPHIKFDPMKELDDLSGRIRKFAEEFPQTFSVEFGEGFEPKIDVMQDDTSIYVYTELPGLKKDDIKLILTESILTIEGEKALPDDRAQLKVSMREASFGPFKRNIALPSKIDAGSITASMSDGILSVKLSKQIAQKDEEIEIEIK